MDPNEKKSFYQAPLPVFLDPAIRGFQARDKCRVLHKGSLGGGPDPLQSHMEGAEGRVLQPAAQDKRQIPPSEQEAHVAALLGLGEYRRERLAAWRISVCRAHAQKTGADRQRCWSQRLWFRGSTHWPGMWPITWSLEALCAPHSASCYKS